MKRIQIGAVLGWVVALVAAGCSPVGDASGPDWFVVPDRFTNGSPDASVGERLSDDNMFDPILPRGSGGGGGGSAGAPNGGTGGVAPSDAGSEPDGGPLGPFGIGDPWYFDAPEELADFQVIDHLGIATYAWSAAGADGDAGVGDGGVGHAGVASGHIDLSVAFTAPNQVVQFRILLPYFTDFTGRVLKVRVKRAPGVGQGGVQAFVQSTETWEWVSGTWDKFSDLEELTDVTLDFDTATDPTQVIRFGIQLHSGTEPGNFETTHVAIDEIRIE